MEQNANVNVKAKSKRRIPWFWIVFIIMLTAFFASAQQSLIGGVIIMVGLVAGYGIAALALKKNQVIRLPLIIVSIVSLVVTSGWSEVLLPTFWRLVFIADVGLLIGGFMYDPPVKWSK